MKAVATRLWAGAFLLVLAGGSLVWVLSGEPLYYGRPVSQWAVDYSQKLYPSGTVPLSPSQRGVQALRQMGPRKAATALVHALGAGDSRLYRSYRGLYPMLPAWYQQHFPLRLTPQQRSTLILGAIDFFDTDYQKSLVPFLAGYLQMRDPAVQVAACELLGAMPQAALETRPALQRLATESDLQVSGAARAALSRLTN